MRRKHEVPLRTMWRAPSLKMVDEPLVASLWKYRLDEDRWQTHMGDANLVSSITGDGRHLPIIDLDFEHVYLDSTSPGHAHLFINVPMSRWKWLVLMTALRYTGVIELGFYVWSLRRGGNFVRASHIRKWDSEATKPTYGWFFKLKPNGRKS